ncbi:MAG: hypothetical protein P8J91_08620 [Pirellulaceae bacterium]|nr:hypothetical protein [Pirellulaceae bacterium]MDG2103800.1 hypothetical protein [Pirellulaceae bacterium]
MRSSKSNEFAIALISLAAIQAVTYSGAKVSSGIQSGWSHARAQ